MASSGEPSGTEIPVDITRLPVGTALRTRREQLGWSMQEVAAWLRIRLPYLEALEGGQVSKLPGNAYAMGFLRAYATALGLDADDMIRRFRGETKDMTRKPELSFPVPVPERGVPAGAIVLLGVVMVVAAYMGWYELGGRLTHQAHTVPPVPDALTPYAGGTASGPSPQVATVMPGPGQTPSKLPPAGPDGRADDSGAQKPAVTASPETAGVAADMPKPTVQAPAVTQAPSQTAAQAPVVAGAPASTSPPVVPPLSGIAATGTSGAATQLTPSSAPAANTPAIAGVTLNAVATSWVQVRQVGGKVIYDHVLQAGEHWAVPSDSGEVVLSTGNAGGITVSADGVTSPVLGRIGGVRRGIPLTAEAVRSGSVVAPASGDAARGGSGSPAASTIATPATGSTSIPAPVAAPVPAATAPAATAPATKAPAAPVPATTAPAVPATRPAPRVHPPTPRPVSSDDETETDRLNRAQLKQAPPQP